MAANFTLLLMIVTLTVISAQTFQYSRGWTNGKRSKADARDSGEVTSNVERLLSPCQIGKLKYLLEGKPLNDRLFAPCDYLEDEDTQSKRYKNDRGPDLPLFETFH